MKKLFAFLVAAIVSIGVAHAEAPEPGNFAAGINFNYGNLTESFGFGIRGQYTIINNLRGEVAVNYFTKHKGVKAWDVNINAQYLVALWSDKLFIYPLAGLNYTMATFNEEGIKDEENHVGLNLGAGAEYSITENVNLFLEYRHTIERKIDQGVFALGATYRF